MSHMYHVVVTQDVLNNNQSEEESEQLIHLPWDPSVSPSPWLAPGILSYPEDMILLIDSSSFKTAKILPHNLVLFIMKSPISLYKGDHSGEGCLVI